MRTENQAVYSMSPLYFGSTELLTASSLHIYVLCVCVHFVWQFASIYLLICDVFNGTLS
jgi:hypothetical protein